MRMRSMCKERQRKECGSAATKPTSRESSKAAVRNAHDSLFHLRSSACDGDGATHETFWWPSAKSRVGLESGRSTTAGPALVLSSVSVFESDVKR